MTCAAAPTEPDRSDVLEAVLARLAASYVPLAPAAEVLERLEVLYEDPPVLYVPDFWPADACRELIQATTRSGLLRQSHCTEDGVRVQGLRTSSSAVLRPQVLRRFSPSAAGLARRLHRDLGGALGLGAGEVPLAELTCEYPQVVRYERGQHFAPHEDAFPWSQVRRTHYQRRATLLVYLNDVAEGGCTTFARLDLRVRPRRGAALLFFPAFADGRPDARTRHEAEEAVGEKWIAQVWSGCAPGHPGGGHGLGGRRRRSSCVRDQVT